MVLVHGRHLAGRMLPFRLPGSRDHGGKHCIAGVSYTGTAISMATKPIRGGTGGKAFPWAGARGCLRPPLRAGTPRNAPGSGAGLMTRSVPQGHAALLLRARHFRPWAPRALRLRLAWAKARSARRQGPAGASGPGHDAWPACGRGAHCLLAELAGRSPVMTHGGVCGRRACAPALLVEALRKWRGGRRSRLGTLGPAATRP